MKNQAKILLYILLFLLTGCEKKVYIEDFYIEINTSTPLKNIVTEISHHGVFSCSAFFIPVYTGRAPIKSGALDYYSSKKLASNEKTLFKGGWVSTGCIGMDDFQPSINIKLSHPELRLDAGAIYRIKDLSNNKSAILSIKENTIMEAIRNCQSSAASIPKSCSVKDQFESYFPVLLGYIKHVSGEFKNTEYLFEDAESAKTYVQYYKKMIINHPALTDEDRIYLLSELKEQFFGL